MCTGVVLVSQSQSIECIRAVPAWVGIKAIDSRASVGGASEETGNRRKRIEDKGAFVANVFSTVSERQWHWRQSLGGKV